MSSKNISFNTVNIDTFNTLIKATGKPTRQAAIASVLSAATNAKYHKHINVEQEKKYIALSNAHKSVVNENEALRDTVHNYRIGFVMIVVALAMAVIL